MNKFKFYVRKALGLTVHYYYPRARVPAETHLPVLLGIARLFPIERVLEFGAGKFSTLTFLDRRFFPDVKSVTSFETDKSWRDRVEEMAEGDSRLRIELVGEDVASVASNCKYEDYDLTFVDSGPHRVEVIKEIVSQEPRWKLVLIHDYEHPPYAEAARMASRKFCFSGYCPHTGALWNEKKLGKGVGRKFKMLNKAIVKHAKQLEAGDTENWAQIMQKARLGAGSRP